MLRKLIAGEATMPHIDWPTLWANLTHLGAFDSVTHPVMLVEKVLLTLSNTVQNAIIGNDTSLLGGAVGAAALLGANAVLVRIFYRGPSEELLFNTDRDICLIEDGRLREDEMRRLRINAAELTDKAHERSFDSLAEVESAMLYPNGTIYFRGRSHETEAARHAELLRRLDALSAEVAALRR